MNYAIGTRAESIERRAKRCSKRNKSSSQSEICGGKRRGLPLAGAERGLRLSVGQRRKVGQRVKFSELFGDKNTLLLYSFMFGPNWDNPCPSCTSLVDGFDRTLVFGQSARRVRRNRQGAGGSNQRVGQETRMVADSAGLGIGLTYQADYRCQEASDDMQLPVMHVFRRRDGKIFHFWGTESIGQSCRHGVAVLESHGLYARGPARHSDSATEFQVRILGETLSE